MPDQPEAGSDSRAQLAVQLGLRPHQIGRVCVACHVCGLTVGDDGKCEEGCDAPPSSLDYENCGRGCVTPAGHTMTWGVCEHAPRPQHRGD